MTPLASVEFGRPLFQKCGRTFLLVFGRRADGYKRRFENLMMSTQGSDVRLFDNNHPARDEGIKFVEDNLSSAIRRPSVPAPIMAIGRV
jgi:hypothetical protein